MTEHWTDSLVTLNACTEAVEWALTHPDAQTAWDRCERVDWMLWLPAFPKDIARRLAFEFADRAIRVDAPAALRAAAEAVPEHATELLRHALELEMSPHVASIETATVADERARAAAGAAGAAESAAWSAGAAGAAGADAWSAARAASWAARAAARSAGAAQAARAAGSAGAAGAARHREMCDRIRELVPNVPDLKEVPK